MTPSTPESEETRPTDAAMREFKSREHDFTPENLAKARATLTRGQDMDWLLDDPPNCPHKTPCFPINDVEWLFGFLDAALEAAAALRQPREGAESENRELLERYREALREIAIHGSGVSGGIAKAALNEEAENG